ncbi:MAG: DUF4347 domain-containing protein [Planctomycetota bacterium]
MQVHQDVEAVQHESDHAIQLVLVDSAVEDPGQAIDSFLDAHPNQNFQINMLHSHSNGIEQIDSLLKSSSQSFQSVHLLATSSDGNLNLGSSVLNASNLDSHKQNLFALSDRLGPDAEIVIHESSLSQTDSGVQLLKGIADFTGLDVNGYTFEDTELSDQSGSLQENEPVIQKSSTEITQAELEQGEISLAELGVTSLEANTASEPTLQLSFGFGPTVHTQPSLGLFQVFRNIDADRFSVTEGNLFDEKGPEIAFEVVAIENDTQKLGQAVTTESGAKLTIRSDGSFEYDPDGNFSNRGVGNTDTITYTIKDAKGQTSVVTANFVIGVERVIKWDLDLAETNLVSVGDVTGNGFSDYAFSIPEWDSNRGVTFLIHGDQNGVDLDLDVNNLLEVNGGDGSQGTIFYGIDIDDLSGESLAAAGDVNGDGQADFLIGASNADVGNQLNAGESYLILGQTNNLTAEVDLESLTRASGGDGSRGMILQGISKNDLSGSQFTQLGDVNGDGLDDIGIGVANADVNGKINSGQTFVVYGSQQLDAEKSLQLLADGDGTEGFAINGVKSHDQYGGSLQSADIDRDGLNDLVISTQFADANGLVDSGQTFVVYGSSDRSGSLNLADLLVDGSQQERTLVLNGTSRKAGDGANIEITEDINGDGLLDFTANVQLVDGSFRSEVILNQADASKIELISATQAAVMLDKLHTPEEMEGRDWSRLTDNVTLHSTIGTSVTIWGNRHVVTEIDGFKEWFDIGYGAGEIELESGKVVRWDSDLSSDPGVDEFLPLTSFEIHNDSDTYSITVANEQNLVDQMTELSETDLRELAWMLKEYAGDRQLPLTRV